MATGGQEQPGNLSTYAQDLAKANADLQAQTNYFGLVRSAIEILAAYAQDNSKGVKGLPIIQILDPKDPDGRGIKLELDVIGPQAALTCKPLFEMTAGVIGTALQQSWARVNQVNTHAQQVLQIANQLQHDADLRQKQQAVQPQR